MRILGRFIDPFNVGSLSAIFHQGSPIKQDIPEVIPFLEIWRRKATAFRFLHALLGSLSVIFSLLTTTLLAMDSMNFWAKVSAFIAAVSIGLMTAFNLGTKSNSMTNAWRKLTAAAIRYNKGLIEKKDVINAYVEAEGLIGDVTFDQSAPAHPDTDTVTKTK